MNVGESTGPQQSRTMVRVLGGFELTVDLRPIPLPTQAQRVIGYLAVVGSPVQRDSLAGRLWPFSSQGRAQANLRTALWRIKQASAEVVQSARNWVRLSEEVDVDSQRAHKLAQELMVTETSHLLTATSVELLTADLLPGWDEDWLVVERERMRQLRIHALEALSRHLRAIGRYGEAIDAALSAVGAEPLRESAHIALIEAYIAEGNLSEATRQVEAYRRLLQLELGLQPSLRIQALLAGSR